MSDAPAGPDEDADGDDGVDLEVRWAAALLSELIDTGGIEVVGEAELLASGILEEIAAELAKGPDDLGERLLAVMLDSSGIDEVFISEKALIERLGTSRPTDPT